jgi:hypothetical protein
MRWIILCVPCVFSAAGSQAAPIGTVTRQIDGALIAMAPGTLRLQVMSDAVIHVTYSAGDLIPELKSYS